MSSDGPNPFLRFRDRLDSYEPVRSGRMSDDEFVGIVSDLDAAVAAVEGSGFTETPVTMAPQLAAAIGLTAELIIKDETHNVSGSHKARHLMGVAIDMLVSEALGAPESGQLAIASCGNAALAAGVVAAAMARPLEVFVPTWADQIIVDRLIKLGANITSCERRPNEVGDPAYLRFREAVSDGSVPFSVQGTDTPTTFDGGRTLGWELAEQASGIDSIYIQVGGGALATAVSMALPSAALYPVQSSGCAPLGRAWGLLAPGFDLVEARANPDEYMWAWDEPASTATGILDDITYDWLPLLERTLETGGRPVVALEPSIDEAYGLANKHTEIKVSPTGSAGLAGLMADLPVGVKKVAVLFTGIDR